MSLLSRSDKYFTTKFKQIFETFHQKVFNYIFRIVANRESAEDLLQDVFLKIYQGLPTYREKKKLTPWIFTITRNTINDYFRKQNVYQSYFSGTEDDTILDNISKTENSPETILISQEIKDNFERIVVDLPYKLKEVFLLRHEADLSFKEISKMLHCPVNTLLGRMYLANKQVREQMKKLLNQD
jgi:RNA polymerase sigma-70 factor, ECF subfamily